MESTAYTIACPQCSEPLTVIVGHPLAAWLVEVKEPICHNLTSAQVFEALTKQIGG